MLLRRDLLKLALTLPAAELIGSTSASARNIGIREPITPQFLPYSPIWKDIKLDKDPNPIESQFGVSVRDMDGVIRSVLRRIPRIGLPEERTISAVAKAIDSEVKAAIQGSRLRLGDFATQWLLAEGACRWVFLNVYYDNRQVGSDGVAIDFARLGKPSVVLNSDPPVALCGGISCTIRDIGRALGLKCYKVDGHMRELGNTERIGQNHSIACFEFPGGLKVPGDLANAGYRGFTKDGKRVFVKVLPVRLNEAWTLPRRPEAWEIFLARFCTWDGIMNGKQIVNWDGDLQGVHRFHSLKYPEWIVKETASLEPLLKWLWQQQDIDMAKHGGAS